MSATAPKWVRLQTPRGSYQIGSRPGVSNYRPWGSVILWGRRDRINRPNLIINISVLIRKSLRWCCQGKAKISKLRKSNMILIKWSSKIKCKSTKYQILWKNFKKFKVLRNINYHQIKNLMIKSTIFLQRIKKIIVNKIKQTKFWK